MSEVARKDNEADRKHYVTLDAEFWQENPIAFVYFVYMNPMFVVQALYGGYQTILMSIISVYVLSMLRETEHAR